MPERKFLGTQFMVELWDCNHDIICNSERIEKIFIESIKKAAIKIIDTRFYCFSPVGLSGVIIISKSHIAIHTWPEHSFVAVDVFTCGDDCRAWEIIEDLRDKLQANQVGIMEVKRGLNINFKTGEKRSNL